MILKPRSQAIPPMLAILCDIKKKGGKAYKVESITTMGL